MGTQPCGAQLGQVTLLTHEPTLLRLNSHPSLSARPSLCVPIPLLWAPTQRGISHQESETPLLGTQRSWGPFLSPGPAFSTCTAPAPCSPLAVTWHLCLSHPPTPSPHSWLRLGSRAPTHLLKLVFLLLISDLCGLSVLLLVFWGLGVSGGPGPPAEVVSGHLPGGWGQPMGIRQATPTRLDTTPHVTEFNTPSHRFDIGVTSQQHGPPPRDQLRRTLRCCVWPGGGQPATTAGRAGHQVWGHLWHGRVVRGAVQAPPAQPGPHAD